MSVYIYIYNNFLGGHNPPWLLLEIIFQFESVSKLFFEGCCFYTCKMPFGLATLPWINMWRKTPLPLAIYTSPAIAIDDLTKLGGKCKCDRQFGHTWQAPFSNVARRRSWTGDLVIHSTYIISIINYNRI